MATNDSTIERVLLWMVSGLSGTDLETACIAKLNVDPAEVKAIIAEARKQLTLAAEYNRNEMLGTALTRLNDIYTRCIRTGACRASAVPFGVGLDYLDSPSAIPAYGQLVTFGQLWGDERRVPISLNEGNRGSCRNIQHSGGGIQEDGVDCGIIVVKDLGLAQVRQAAARDDVKVPGGSGALSVDRQNLRNHRLSQPEPPGIIPAAGCPGVGMEVAFGLGIIKGPDIVMRGCMIFQEPRVLSPDPELGQQQDHLPYRSLWPGDRDGGRKENVGCDSGLYRGRKMLDEVFLC